MLSFLTFWDKTVKCTIIRKNRSLVLYIAQRIEEQTQGDSSKQYKFIYYSISSNKCNSIKIMQYLILKCKTMRIAQYIFLKVHSFRKYLKNINYLDSLPFTINVSLLKYSTVVVIHVQYPHSYKTGGSAQKTSWISSAALPVIRCTVISYKVQIFSYSRKDDSSEKPLTELWANTRLFFF